MKKLSVTDIDMIESFVTKHHGDQKYGDEPHIYHLRNVVKNTSDVLMKMTNCGQSTNSYTLCTILAYMHDLLEDTSCTEQEIMSFIKADLDSIVDAFDVVTYLLLLNHKDGVSYSDYIINMVDHWFVMLVKHGDLTHNISEGESKKNPTKYEKCRLDKYRLARHIIESKIG